MILPFRSTRRPGRRPRHLVHGRANALRASDRAAADDRAIAFWQAEVHQFEFRAGEQGALAQSAMAVAAALTTAAVTAFAAGDLGVGNEAMDGLNRWIQFTPLLLPVTILLLLSSALRLLGEADLLRECVRHAETELEKLTSRTPDLGSYRKWTVLGLRYDKPVTFSLIFVPTAAIVSLVGVFGATTLVGISVGSIRGWIPTLVALFFAIMLWVFARANAANASALRVALAEARGERVPES
ncbi:hypothetical protein AB1046_00075 [Promicromonospora sp. Populi]|uniref:hypothetical protein n=1 Tax=Promicromonospora sp. Populi TaxID=3239420 RepID=UPI0034E1F406